MINGKISLHDILDINKQIYEKLDKMETRISALEIWRAELIGKVTAIIAIVNFGIAISFDWIKKEIFGNRI